MRDSADTTNISWLNITGPVGGTYTVTVNPDIASNNDALEGTALVYKLKTKFTNFTATSVFSSITITVGATTCNCALLTWNAAPTKVT